VLNFISDCGGLHCLLSGERQTIDRLQVAQQCARREDGREIDIHIHVPEILTHGPCTVETVLEHVSGVVLLAIEFVEAGLATVEVRGDLPVRIG
jgi:hypothetical protein